MTELKVDPIDLVEEGTVITLSENFVPVASIGNEKVTFEYLAGSCAQVFCAQVNGLIMKDILIGNGTFKTPFITANPNNSELAKIAALYKAKITNTCTYAISRGKGNFEELKIYR